MKYSKILLSSTVLICLAFQACAQSDPLGESSSGSTMGSGGDYLNPNMDQAASHENIDEGVSGMVQWLDQPVSEDVSTSTAISKTTANTNKPASTTESTTTTSTTTASKPTSTTTATATSTTPGFEAAFAAAGLMAVTFMALRRRR